MSEDLYRRIADLEKRLTRLEAAGWPRTQYSIANVLDPPLDGNLDADFGTPATLGPGFIGVVNDNNADTDIWLCVTTATKWYYIQLTEAL